MGKPLKPQKRGKGSQKYRSPKARFKAKSQYRQYDDVEKAGLITGKVLDFVDDVLRDAPLMKVLYDDQSKGHLIAPEGIAVGDCIEAGSQATVAIGNILPLYRIPEGTYVFNLERMPGDGGKYVKVPGSYGILVSKEGNKVTIRLPSRKSMIFSSDARAQIGVVAGGGRKEKPLLKAGKNYYRKKAKNRLWPIVRGVAQNAYNHPHGGKQHHVGKPTTVARGTPPGGKVGHIAARSTGRKKSKR
ncbi:50S ribosomal protein L2 [Candidatus Micrarchaeota archaeon]|nr:50S ribosomal protein L2 [Candidatus Micrarchaeota archaeon]